MLNLIKQIRSAFLHGKAFKKMENGNYVGAASILEVLCKDENARNIEYSYYRLGDCYYRLGKYEKAVGWLKKSFEIYQANIHTNKEDRYKNCYNDLKNTFSEVLKRTGRHEYANLIKSKHKKHT